MSNPHLLHEAVLECSEHPQACSFAFIDEFDAAIIQHLSTVERGHTHCTLSQVRLLASGIKAGSSCSMPMCAIITCLPWCSGLLKQDAHSVTLSWRRHSSARSSQLTPRHFVSH